MAKKIKDIEKNSLNDNDVNNESKESPLFEVSEELADFVLKNFPEIDEAYVSRFGGVFLKGTAKNIIGDAKLFKNKYYKQ